MLPNIIRNGKSEDFRVSNFHSTSELTREAAQQPKFSVTTASYNPAFKSEQRQRTPYEPRLIIRYQKNLKQNLRNPILSQQIKELDRKIRQCEKRLRETKRKQKQQSTQSPLLQQSLEDDTADTKKAFPIPEINRFDFLTNPGKRQDSQQQQQPQMLQEEQILTPPPAATENFIEQNIQKLGAHYAKDLRRKFERREMMPHRACRRKVPKLVITHQSNAVEKTGRPLNQQEHMFRIYTKEVTPQEIYPTIPNFPVVRDNISKNIAAYLIDFKPFIQKTKQEYPFVAQKLEKKNKTQNDQEEKAPLQSVVQEQETQSAEQRAV